MRSTRQWNGHDQQISATRRDADFTYVLVVASRRRLAVSWLKRLIARRQCSREDAYLLIAWGRRSFRLLVHAVRCAKARVALHERLSLLRMNIYIRVIPRRGFSMPTNEDHQSWRYSARCSAILQFCHFAAAERSTKVGGRKWRRRRGGMKLSLPCRCCYRRCYVVAIARTNIKYFHRVISGTCWHGPFRSGKLYNLVVLFRFLLSSAFTAGSFRPRYSLLHGTQACPIYAECPGNYTVFPLTDILRSVLSAARTLRLIVIFINF